MNIPEILKSSDKIINQHLDLLVADFKDKTGEDVCRSCRSDLAAMVLKLKNLYKMTNFELKKLNGIYRVQKGTPQTISNDKMTDELAIAFLKVRPSRIELFSKYPENWEELIGLKPSKQEAEVVVEPEAEEPVEENKKTTKKSSGCSNCKKKTATRKSKSSNK